MTKRDRRAYWAGVVILLVAISIAMSIEMVPQWTQRIVSFVYGAVALFGFERARAGMEGR